MCAVHRVGVRTVGGDMAGWCDILALPLELPVGSTGQRLSKEQVLLRFLWQPVSFLEH